MSNTVVLNADVYALEGVERETFMLMASDVALIVDACYSNSVRAAICSLRICRGTSAIIHETPDQARDWIRLS